MSREDTGILARRFTGNVEAYHLYLKGRFYWAKRTEDGLVKSIQYFRQALECDPTYALAYAGLADGYIPQGYYGYLAPTEAFPRAREAAARALEIDPDLSEARSVIAMIKGSYDWDLAGAEREARAAIARSPNYPRVRQTLAECLSVLGRDAEAVAEIRRGLDLDPLALYMNAAVVMTHYFTRQFDAAITHGQTTIDMDPGFYPAHIFLGLSYQQMGRVDEAVASLERATSLSGRSTMTVAALAGALAGGGRAQDAANLLRELEDAAARGRYVSGAWVAAVFAALGDTDRALSALDQARKDRCCWLLRCMRLDARFDRPAGGAAVYSDVGRTRPTEIAGETSELPEADPVVSRHKEGFHESQNECVRRTGSSAPRRDRRGASQYVGAVRLQRSRDAERLAQQDRLEKSSHLPRR